MSVEKFHDNLNRVMAVLSTLSAGYSVYYSLGHFGPTYYSQRVFIAVFWALFPPAYFWLDYYFFIQRRNAQDRAHLLHMQELSKNIWLGVAGVLGSLAAFG